MFFSLIPGNLTRDNAHHRRDTSWLDGFGFRVLCCVTLLIM